MIDDLDEALRQMLIAELPIRDGEVDIQFKQPRREWSARLSRPTLNLYLYDIRENVKLRQHSPLWSTKERTENTVTQQRVSTRLDLYYAITAWANEPEDEHRMLTRILMVFFRNRLLPEQFMNDTLKSLPAAIQMLVAQPDMLHNPSDFWSSIDNEIRPTITCNILMPLDPYQPFVTPILTKPPEFRFQNTQTHETEEFSSSFWEVRGSIHGADPKRGIRIKVVEENTTVMVQRNGEFKLPRVTAGKYTLEVAVGGAPPTQHTIDVPSEAYIIDLSNRGE